MGRVREVPLYHHCNGNGYHSNGCLSAYTVDSSDSSLLSLACCVEGKGKTGEAAIWYHLCGREVSVLEPSGSEEAQRHVQPCKPIVLAATVALDCSLPLQLKFQLMHMQSITEVPLHFLCVLSDSLQETNALPAENSLILAEMKKEEELKRHMKHVMPFVQHIKARPA